MDGIFSQFQDIKDFSDERVAPHTKEVLVCKCLVKTIVLNLPSNIHHILMSYDDRRGLTLL